MKRVAEWVASLPAWLGLLILSGWVGVLGAILLSAVVHVFRPAVAMAFFIICAGFCYPVLVISWLAEGRSLSSSIRHYRKRKCPECAEWIQPEALVCKHCGNRSLTVPPTVEGS